MATVIFLSSAECDDYGPLLRDTAPRILISVAEFTSVSTNLRINGRSAEERA